MLPRRAFLWLIAASLAGLLPALMLSGLAARHVLESAALERQGRQASALAEALQSPSPPVLPVEAILYAPDGVVVSGDPNLVDHLAGLDLPVDTQGAMPTAATGRQVKGLLAVEVLRAGDGAVLGSLALWRPAVAIEVRLVSIMLGALRNGGLLLLLTLPAAWIATRLLLAPIASACAGSAALLDRLREADGAAEEVDKSLDASALLADLPVTTDAEIAAMARAAVTMLARVDETAAAVARAEAEAALP